MVGEMRSEVNYGRKVKTSSSPTSIGPSPLLWNSSRFRCGHRSGKKVNIDVVLCDCVGDIVMSKATSPLWRNKGIKWERDGKRHSERKFDKRAPGGRFNAISSKVKVSKPIVYFPD